MTCGCRAGKSNNPAEMYTVVTPSGKRKTYISQAAANAVASSTPGSYVVPPAVTPSAS